MISNSNLRLAAAVLALAAAASAQQAAPPTPTPAAAPASTEPAAPAPAPPPPAKPRSAAAMQDSLARQRAAMAKQTGQAASDGFFVLAPPARMGANAFAPASAPVADCDPLPASEVDALVQRSAKSHDLDEDLLRGVIKQESAFRPCAVSSQGAMGLMQLMPATASQFGVPDPFDPAGNVEAGAAFLKQLLVRYGGDLTKALGAYNAGPGKVDAAAGVPKIPETQDYVNKILSTLPVKK